MRLKDIIISGLNQRWMRRAKLKQEDLMQMDFP